jgi:hypothetical protein
MVRIDFQIVDMLGKTVFTSDYSPITEGDQVIQFAITNVAPGYYVLKIMQKQQVIGIQKLIVKN